MSISPLLELQQLQCSRDQRVLFSGVDYCIDRGDIVHLQGTNGIGKTTLLRAIMGLFLDYRGNILWCGEPTHKVSYEYLANTLFIGHLPGVKKTLTPRENLRFLANLHSHHNHRGHYRYSTDQIDRALAEVGLYGYEDMPGYQLSAGQNRRIALARLQLTEALLWVLDEPYAALDAEAVKALEQQLVHHAQRGGCVLMTSHQLPNIPGLNTLSLSDYRPSTTVIDDQESVVERYSYE